MSLILCDSIMKEHVTSLCKNSTLSCASSDIYDRRYHSTPESLTNIIIIGSGLDYCNSLLHGVSADLLQKQHSVQTLYPASLQRREVQPCHLCTSRSALIVCLQEDGLQGGNLCLQMSTGMAPPYLVKDCASILSSWSVSIVFGKRLRLWSVVRKCQCSLCVCVCVCLSLCMRACLCVFLLKCVCYCNRGAR